MDGGQRAGVRDRPVTGEGYETKVVDFGRASDLTIT
jgi:hypothetical protein